MASALINTWKGLPWWAKIATAGAGAYAANEAWSRMTEKSVDGEVVLITGGGSGIGRLMALKLGKLKAKVVLWDVNEKAVDAVAREIIAAGGEAKSAVVDVTNSDSVRAAASAIKEEFGPVDILINNAGIVSGKNMLENSERMIKRTFDVNCVSHFWTVKAFLPDMIARNHGHIVTISSASAFTGVAGMADYVASKWAVFGFHESLRMEVKKLGKTGVHTTCVCPYYINTGMFDGVKSKFPILLPILQPEYVASRVVTAIRRNTELVVMPFTVFSAYLVRTLAPVKLFDYVISLLGINSSMDEFKGRAVKAPEVVAASGSSESKAAV